jgi:hypothetical protein
LDAAAGWHCGFQHDGFLVQDIELIVDSAEIGSAVAEVIEDGLQGYDGRRL